MPKTTGLTYKDLLEMFPEETVKRIELIGGELVVSPPPSSRHGWAVGEIFLRLALHAREHGGRAYTAPTGVFLAEDAFLEPDVLYLRPESLGKVERPFIRGAPNLAVEISSPTTRRDDLVRKRDLYERHGVPEYWFVDLESDEVRVFRLAEEGTGAPRSCAVGRCWRRRCCPGSPRRWTRSSGPPRTRRSTRRRARP